VSVLPENEQEGARAIALRLQKLLGRPPRVLHVGNIANNAFTNAKMMRGLDIDCDVICADYYHIMSNPEWEEADFSAEFEDEYRPDWYRVDLNGYVRPHWFVQGPMPLCLDYLIARNEHATLQAQKLELQLSKLNGTKKGVSLRYSLSRILADLEVLCSTAIRNTKSFLLGRSQQGFQYMHILLLQKTNEYVPTGIPLLFGGGAVKRLSVFYKRAGNYFCRWLLSQYKSVFGPRLSAVDEPKQDVFGFARRFSWCRYLAALLKRMANATKVFFLYALVGLAHVGIYAIYLFALCLQRFVYLFLFISRLVNNRTLDFPGKAEPDGWDIDPIQLIISAEELAAELSDELHLLFPEKNAVVAAVDLEQYQPFAEKWLKMAEHYDIIQAYATDPIPLMIAGIDYFAFEHGTLRDIPYGDNATARLTALAYHRAHTTFVTNSDCVESGRKLCGDRAVLLPHPYDESQTHGNEEAAVKLREQLCEELDAEFLFFSPTRHDWVSEDGFSGLARIADKGNDRFISTFARLVAAGEKVGLVFCEWGRDVNHSKRLLEENNCTARTKWLKPLGTVVFQQYLRASDIVVDQFVLGAFGGVTFRALSFAKPVCTYLNEGEVASHFGSPPPILNCRTENEVYDTIRRCLDGNIDLLRLGAEARQWVETNHSGSKTMEAQLKHYETYLATSASRNSGYTNMHEEETA